MLYIILFAPALLIVAVLLAIYIIKRQKRKRNIILLSKLDVAAIVNQQQIQKEHSVTDLNFKLLQAGITLKEYNEARIIFVIIGVILLTALPILFSFTVGLIGVCVGILCIVYGGAIYIAIAKAERVEKINQDLGTFLDLVNVILEAGGSLKNAFFTVSTKAKNIIDDELLKEIAILEYEMTNYSTKQAYENLKNRVDSEEMTKIVDFLILSEETGIGVKNIFTTQSEEMRQDKFFQIKGKVNTLNMYLIIVIFIFILPAVGAFVIFPMRSGAISTGF
ncbi:MAG: type II secretion system F family protein [Campylobacterota bacterium]|nr:type II secretion system F family protein [Campylobacterota bacterium]